MFIRDSYLFESFDGNFTKTMDEYYYTTKLDSEALLTMMIGA